MTFEDINFDAEREYLKAVEALEAGKWSSAFEVLIDITKNYPEFAKGYYSLGWLFFHKLGNHRLALKMYNKCLELDIESIKFQHSFIHVLIVMKEFKTLKTILTSAEKLPGIDLSIIFDAYGQMYELQGDFDKALEYYKKSLELDINNGAVEHFNDAVKRCNRKQEILT
ncbi:MAG: tetratricopeptide repeat protein [Candidatus Dojkabacteria bacterium]|nr:tetratricopeptide repeat protein [Candidatus Dojkabacteria bacterium]MDQ7020417.1 tetratricopeptide repeat protein [Candidatus Dojkabacteria bacterium]